MITASPRYRPRFTGTAGPHGSVNVFDVSIKFGGGSCLSGSWTLTGIGFYDATLNRMYAVALNAAGRTAFCSSDQNRSDLTEQQRPLGTTISNAQSQSCGLYLTE